jgi:hypothetical protein
LIGDISHNLPSSFTVYINKAAPTIYIENSNITSIGSSYSILPVTGYKEYAIANAVTLLATANPTVTWNFNQTWGVGPLPAVGTVSPNGTGISCFVAPSEPAATDITITKIRSLASATVTTGTSSSVASGSLVVTAGTFTGNVISIGASFASLSSAAIAGGPSEISPGSPVYLNLANLHLTFLSSIC